MNQYNILVCDDDKEIVEAIQVYLEQEGYRVLTAYDGEEVLNAIKKRVNEDGYFISMDLDKLADIVSTSFTPRIALYRIKHQMNIKPILHRTRKIFSNYNDYNSTIDTRPISPDEQKYYYDFFLSDKADANSEFIQRHVKWFKPTHR